MSKWSPTSTSNTNNIQVIFSLAYSDAHKLAPLLVFRITAINEAKLRTKFYIKYKCKRKGVRFDKLTFYILFSLPKRNHHNAELK